MLDQRAVNVLLCVFIAIGLIIGLCHSVNLELTSDMTVPGIVAMEIVNYHDFQFTYPVNDPYLFTDIFTFHFIPQVLSGYDPAVLRLTAYGIFLIIVAVFSYLVYRYSSLPNALLFAAITTNLSPDVYWLFISPNYHVGTLLFAGIFLLAFSPETVENFRLSILAVLVFIVGLIVISDSLIIIIFILPYVIYCAYRYLRKSPVRPKVQGKTKSSREAVTKKGLTEKTETVMLFLIIVTASVYLLKKHNFFTGLDILLLTPISIVSLDTAASHLPLFFDALIILVNANLYNLLNHGITMYDLILATVFICVLIYSLGTICKKARFLYVMFFLSAIIMFPAFVLTNMAVDIWSARFLLYLAVSVFAVISLAYRPTRAGFNLNTLFLAAILLLVTVSIVSNVVIISGYDNQPNKEDIAFVTYLEQKNLTYGFSDYGTSNKLIYFSKEQLLYPKINISDERFESDWMCTSKRWYDVSYQGGKFNLIIGKNDPNYEAELRYVSSHTPLKTYIFENYTVYKYDLSARSGDVHSGTDGQAADDRK